MSFVCNKVCAPSLIAYRDLRFAIISGIISENRGSNMKPQDVVIAFKIIAKHEGWTQNQLAVELCMSQSEVSAGLKRLQESGLLMPAINSQSPTMKLNLLAEFILHGIRYVFPAKLGGLTRGVATSYAAPVFKDKIVSGNDPIPVWPYVDGNAKGLALEPLYPSVSKSVVQYPDELFYELLVLTDAIRSGRAREKNLAEKLLLKKLGIKNVERERK